MERITPENSGLLRAIVGAIPDIVVQTDLDGAILFANEVALRFGGFVGSEDILGRNIFSFVAPSDQEKAAANARRMLAGPLGPVEYRMAFQPGTEFDSEVNGDVLRDGQRVPCGLVFVIRDITERKRTALMLQENEARFRSYFELPLIGIAITTPHKGWLQANDRLCDMLGYSRQELTRLTWAELTHPEDLAGDNERFDLLLTGELDSYMIEKRFIRKDGQLLSTMAAIGCVRNPDRSVNYVVALLQDISARKQMENTLRESEERFRRLAENAQDAIFRMSLADGKYEYMSPAITAMTGYSPAEFYAQPMLIEKIIHPSWREFLAEKLVDVNRGIVPPAYEFQIVHKSGENRWVNQRNVLVRDASGRPIAIEGIVTDISARKLAEIDLQSRLGELQEAIAHIKTLQGILPICSYCHRIRNDQEVWEQLEKYIGEHSDAQFSHGLCPQCLKEHFPEIK